MIDFSTLKGLTIPEGVVTQIADENGIVLWRRRENEEPVIGTLILRPSADISVGHFVVPDYFDAAYKVIKDDGDDGDSTYIETPDISSNDYTERNPLSVISKFKISPTEDLKKGIITSVGIAGSFPTILHHAPQYITLEIDGKETSRTTIEYSSKGFWANVLEAIEPINSFLAEHKELPSMNIIIESTTFRKIDSSGTKTNTHWSGISQVYVSIVYELYE